VGMVRMAAAGFLCESFIRDQYGLWIWSWNRMSMVLLSQILVTRPWRAATTEDEKHPRSFCS
jgi:hypothetical protein